MAADRAEIAVMQARSDTGDFMGDATVAVLRGCDVGKPRNRAKSVTVE